MVFAKVKQFIERILPASSPDRLVMPPPESDEERCSKVCTEISRNLAEMRRYAFSVECPKLKLLISSTVAAVVKIGEHLERAPQDAIRCKGISSDLDTIVNALREYYVAEPGREGCVRTDEALAHVRERLAVAPGHFMACLRELRSDHVMEARIQASVFGAMARTPLPVQNGDASKM